MPLKSAASQVFSKIWNQSAWLLLLSPTWPAATAASVELAAVGGAGVPVIGEEGMRSSKRKPARGSPAGESATAVQRMVFLKWESISKVRWSTLPPVRSAISLGEMAMLA